MNEADTCRTKVRPKLEAAGWDDTPHSYSEQTPFTDGRIIVPAGKPRRLKKKFSDFILRYTRDISLAVVEAKSDKRPAGDGMQQAKEYAEILGLKFAYATNGTDIIEYDYFTSQEKLREEFPTPEELWTRYQTGQALTQPMVNAIPAEAADKSISLADAVDRVLRSLHPRVAVGGGHETLKLGSVESPLLLVVDDVNRSSAPVQLLRKVIGWSRPNSSDGSPSQANSLIRVVCPAWDAIWYPLRHVYESMTWVRVQGIGPMVRPEAVACIKAALGGRAAAYTEAELSDFAERLHDDPILLGLFGQFLRTDPSANPLALAENVIGRIVQQAVGEVSAANHTLPANYMETLNRVSLEMIRRKVLYPKWEEVESWLHNVPEVRGRLEQLVAQGHICRVTDTTGVRRFEFRHDRILDYHLSKAAFEMLVEGGGDGEAVADPFFTPFMGRAIARTEVTAEVLERVRRQNPVALVAAVPFLTTSPSAYADRVVQLARSWLKQTGDYPDSMRYDALSTLAAANSSRVLEVTEGTPENRWVWEARLRNGDAVAGALSLSTHFYPSVRYAWLESLIEQAQIRHSDRLTEELRTLLRSADIDDRVRFGALCLAGYLGDPALAADVETAWKNAGDQKNLLLAALWAGFRCAGSSPAELVGPMMSQLLTLQDDKSGQSLGERGALLQELGFASRHRYGEPVLSYLVNLGTNQEEYRWVVASILDDIDHPIAIGYVVRLLAEAKHKAEQAGGFSPWAQIWGDRWKRKEQDTGNRLSSASIATLRSIWIDERNPEWLAKYSFSLWARHVDDLAEIAAVMPGSRHYDSAVWQRAQRGDRTVAAHVLEKLSSDPHWFHIVRYVWGPEFEHVVDSALDQIAADPERQAKSWSNQQYDMSHLLRDIPTAAAERLLVRHWRGLATLPLFIQAALFHGTAKCRELAAESLTQIRADEKPFSHINSFFGFFTQGLMDRLTKRHLDVLLPYLEQLDDLCLGQMDDFCRRFDHVEWARKNLEPEMRRRVPLAKPDFSGGPSYIVRHTQHSFPTDEELLSELDKIESTESRFQLGRLCRWWDEFLERGDPVDRPGRLLLAWVARKLSPARVIIAAELIAEKGKRRELQSLNDLRPQVENDEVRRAVVDADFAVKRRSLD